MDYLIFTHFNNGTIDVLDDNPDTFQHLVEMADDAEALLGETGAYVVINSSDAGTWCIYDTKVLPADPAEYEALMEGWN